jgi:hypothetical protein
MPYFFPEVSPIKLLNIFFNSVVEFELLKWLRKNNRVCHNDGSISLSAQIGSMLKVGTYAINARFFASGDNSM